LQDGYKNNKSKGVVKGMNENQVLISEALRKQLYSGQISQSKYRDILDVCLAALEDTPSEPTQTGLKGKFKSGFETLVDNIKTNREQKKEFEMPDFLFKKAAILPQPKAMNVVSILNTDEIDKRLNEIADKLNKIYANVNKLKEPVIKKGERKTLDDYPLTERQLHQVRQHVETHFSPKMNINEMIKEMKNKIAKGLREDRLKGGFK